MVTNLAHLIDHTALKPETTLDQIQKLCNEAKEHHFASVCVNPVWVSKASSLLEGTDVKVCTVIGFPLGASISKVKAFETTCAIEDGATEVDMVINIGAMKDGQDDLVKEDIQAVVQAAKNNLVKVILETCLLTKEEIKRASKLAIDAGADFIKTSTGFSSGGATVEDVRLMREVVGESKGVKASGGIRDKETAEAMVAAGASRIGASSSVNIVKTKI
ncbi:deoxyribose-phosphate aldolase [Terrilactibacillus sp. BCM23-1]|uniref:Deoxyribose-phosphate aldolase n=1 Tax=Terrilactibacillus tamarindi TaxID=2599694 RepID=A0A6N8CTF6_9BACI|nr:deoxyribose-phosphate aldolase [Terrilactibacillus tamarindi]MTT32507.1 deoxyribose-phosphate aldolase [Terrilactibacillus tamarindi]